MTADRTAGWGGLARAGAAQMSHAPRMVLPEDRGDHRRFPRWDYLPDMSQPTRERLIAALDVAPIPVSGRHLFVLAGVGMERGCQMLMRLIEEGEVGPASETRPAHSLLARFWQRTP
jgi:hypothetical protein